MIYLGLLAVLGIWAFIAWKDRPIQELARLYFICCALTALSEPIMIRLLQAYELHVWLLPDDQADFALTAIIVGLFLDPLLGVLYARYCRAHPVGIALGAALLLGALEWYMVLTGHVVYLRQWSPLIAAGFFFAFFLMLWWAATHESRIPIWVDTYGVATLWAYGTDLLLQGMFRLWEYKFLFDGDLWESTRTISDLLMSFALCPLVTVVATAPLRYRWVWVVATGVTLWMLELTAWSAGMIAMNGVVATLEVLRRLALVSLATLYAGWMRRPCRPQ